MADIYIVQEHALTPEKARAAAQQVADKIAADYDLECRWEGDVLHFGRSGVEGSLTLQTRRALMEIKLGFLMSSFSSMIEEKIAAKMQKVFAGAA